MSYLLQLEDGIAGRFPLPDAHHLFSRTPFAALCRLARRAEAEADLLAGGTVDGDFDPEDTLQDAECELGLSEWIDPDTGGPAEDSVPRIEDH